jgi:hypothetical protein
LKKVAGKDPLALRVAKKIRSMTEPGTSTSA